MITATHFAYKGFMIKIELDQNPQDPREDENVTVMACFSKRHNLGDKDHGYDANDYANWEQMSEAIIKQENVAAILPVYMYDHGGITIRTTPFDCQWDSGQLGFIWITRKSVSANLGWKRITKKRVKELEATLVQDVATYDSYLTGEVYGYTIIAPDGEPTEHSCWGFYGDSVKENGYAVNEARLIIDSLVDDAKRLALPENRHDQMSLGIPGVP